MLKLFNTLTRKKETFKAKKQVGFYFCGPTVYDFAHIGNFRAYIFADLLRRYLQFLGYKVKMVMNLTDVDDKTIKNSRKENVSLKKFTERYEKAFFEDISKLRIKAASVYPRATEHIPEMIALINALLKKGLAYKGEDGSIYYDISKFPAYGQLSKLEIKELSERVRNDEYTKEQANDFALWKAWDESDGDVFWLAKFGNGMIKGRPGWHIECSAMSAKYLKLPIDVHGGGVDLIFPHHENEIAQSEPLKKRLARLWVHCEHLLVDGKKMSKSLGNFYTLRDVLEKGCNPAALRFLLLNSHYRQQLNFTFESLEKAKETVEALNDFADKLHFLKNKVKAKKNTKLEKSIVQTRKKFIKCMNDDLNVPQALAAIFDMINSVNKSIDADNADKKSLEMCLDLLIEINGIFDIVGKEQISLTKEEKELVEKREMLRKEKNFSEADKIRAELKESGILLEDTPYGSRAKRMKS
ncbi:MAG: cysteine--tRNA ligase [Candidatus Aenigmarchaeota archaeon]|nr:cysteine--tRNA ligase [Candidatus Aenigmarchaeota archaeon]